MQSHLILWAGVASVLIHFLLRLAKSDGFNGLLARFGLPAINQKALPWVALALGLLAGAADALAQGSTVEDAAQKAVLGLLSGAGAVAMHETTKKRDDASAPSDTQDG